MPEYIGVEPTGEYAVNRLNYSVIDEMVRLPNGREQLACSGKGILEVSKLRNEPLVVMTWDQVWTLKQKKYLTGFREIGLERWDYAFECLPPMRWHTVNGVEMFLMREMYSGDITTLYARYKNRCFEARKNVGCDYHVASSEIIAKVDYALVKA